MNFADNLRSLSTTFCGQFFLRNSTSNNKPFDFGVDPNHGLAPGIIYQRDTSAASVNCPAVVGTVQMHLVAITVK